MALARGAPGAGPSARLMSSSTPRAESPPPMDNGNGRMISFGTVDVVLFNTDTMNCGGVFISSVPLVACVSFPWNEDGIGRGSNIGSGPCVQISRRQELVSA